VKLHAGLGHKVIHLGLDLGGGGGGGVWLIVSLAFQCISQMLVGVFELL